MSKSCEQCSSCLLRDEGYSNYTVEGTRVYCIKDKHPENGFDRWYGEDKRLQFANECTEFAEGEAVGLDVDEELWGDLPQEHKDYCRKNKLVWSFR